METKPRRKEAMRIADIPPDVLRALNEGREETITLVEWLAIDMPTLLRSILPSVGLPEAGNELGRVADGLAGEGGDGAPEEHRDGPIRGDTASPRSDGGLRGHGKPCLRHGARVGRLHADGGQNSPP